MTTARLWSSWFRSVPEITIPNEWTPRSYQLPPLIAFEQGKRRQYHVWHRRAGKDSFGLNLTARETIASPGTYWHLFPVQVQARRAIWEGINNDGSKILDRVFPLPIRTNTRQGPMAIDLKSGSTWQMAGSDNYDSLVGSNVRGVVFSEWALCDPAAWDYIRPIILENNGWAVFITTFRGHNHAYTMYQHVKGLPDWFTSLLTVNDTKRADGSPVFTAEQIDSERRDGMSDAMIQQEYFCSPMSAFEGAYWGMAMSRMQAEKRICPVRYDAALGPVLSVFDLGHDDETACIYLQECGNEVRLVGADSWRRTAIPEIVAAMRARGFALHTAVLPHDAAGGGLQTGQSHAQLFQAQGLETVIIPAPPGSVAQSIELVRNLLPRVWIHNELTRLIDALSGYRTEESKHPGVFQLTPAHTWESHFADAMRYYAMYNSRRQSMPGAKSRPVDYSRIDRMVV